MAGTLRLVLGDQLSLGVASLTDMAADADMVLMAEVMAECTYVRHHAKKLVLVLSAMRHFAADLRARGITVDYVTLDDPANTHSLRDEVCRAVRRHRPARVVATAPGEWRLWEDMRGWPSLLAEAPGAPPLDIREDTRFLCRTADFAAWARGRKSLRMEYFYRDMRRRHGLLMQGEEPLGGQWNFDAENRKSLPDSVEVPAPPRFPPDDITREVMALVARRFPDHVGSVAGFALPVTAAEAQAALADFFARRLPGYGDWQDAMKTGAPTLFHSLISSALNLGLLDPLAICRAAQAEYARGHAKLNAVEGFVRQILGWREFVRGLYWLHMPGYATRNFFDATRDLPDFYWTGETRMNCLRQAIGETIENAYAHHIQRLMITGNFALLAGLHPDQVDAWYMAVYADAYEWVEMPNTRGMALFADGGIVGSKPYAASGAYISRMSDYCRSCAYNVKDAEGENACPFNYLYWDFFARNESRLAGNPRLSMPLATLARMAPKKRAAIARNAGRFLTALNSRA